MARSKSYHKNIVCLESFWNRDVENRLSVQPILELASKKNYIKSILLTCNTMEELECNLKIAPGRNGYGILYFAFHGFPGGIIMAASTADLETLAEFMGKKFSNWIVHFGSCRTLHIEERRIFAFMEKTNVLMMVGYKKDVSWMESAAIDLLLLDSIQFYKDMRKFWKRFRMAYGNLVQTTGLKAFHRENRRINRGFYARTTRKKKGGKS